MLAWASEMPIMRWSLCCRCRATHYYTKLPGKITGVGRNTCVGTGSTLVRGVVMHPFLVDIIFSMNSVPSPGTDHQTCAGVAYNPTHWIRAPPQPCTGLAFVFSFWSCKHIQQWTMQGGEKSMPLWQNPLLAVGTAPWSQARPHIRTEPDPAFCSPLSKSIYLEILCQVR